MEGPSGGKELPSASVQELHVPLLLQGAVAVSQLWLCDCWGLGVCFFSA